MTVRPSAVFLFGRLASAGYVYPVKSTQSITSPAHPIKSKKRELCDRHTNRRDHFGHQCTEENLNGVTAGLDRLKVLGVTVVWLMPIHPLGQLKRPGIDGSPYAVRDYYAITPAGQ